MKIQIGGLSEGVHQYHFDAPASEIGLDDAFLQDVTVDATLEKTGTQLYLRADIKTIGRFECDRCVGQFDRPLTSTYQMNYVWDEADTGSLDPAEIQIIPPGLSIINIAEDVRQTILLSVPLKVLCREDCKGLCPQCGKNLNEGACACRESGVDSRWDKLRSLQKSNLQ
jgi:uncharacterized protein